MWVIRHLADGMVIIVDLAMSGSPLSDTDKDAIRSAVKAPIKQKSGTPMERQQESAGRPYAPVHPPSTSPSIGSVSAPREHISICRGFRGIFRRVRSLSQSSSATWRAKRRADAGNYASTKDLTRNVANLLVAAK